MKQLLPSVLECRDVEVAVGGQQILPPTTFSLQSGHTLAVMGPSGSGKTTLFNAIAGITRATSGQIKILEKNIEELSRAGRARFRRSHIGIVSQSPDLLPELSTLENVIFSQLFEKGNRATTRKNGIACLESVGLEHKADADPQTLSGGEAQRVAIARALSRPGLALIVADEPTASLDQENARLVTQLLVGAARDKKIGVLLATHDPAVAHMCDSIQHIVRKTGA